MKSRPAGNIFVNCFRFALQQQKNNDFNIIFCSSKSGKHLQLNGTTKLKMQRLNLEIRSK